MIKWAYQKGKNIKMIKILKMNMRNFLLNFLSFDELWKTK